MRPPMVLLSATLGIVSVTACGSSTSSPSGPSSCTPGESIACVGAGGCAGGQVCQADGTYGSCDCGSGDSAVRVDTGSEISSEVAVDSSSFDAPDVTDTTAPADASDGTVADAAAITPSDLAGLSLWLDADKGVTTCSDGFAVTMWQDQSGNANDAKLPCSGSGGVTAPRVIPDDIKGHNAIFFGGSGYNRSISVADDTTLQFGIGPFAIMLVLSAPTGTTATHLFFKGGSTPSNSFDVNLDSNVNATTPSADAHAYFSSSGYHVAVVRGPAFEIRIDGVATKGKTATEDLSYPGLM